MTAGQPAWGSWHAGKKPGRVEPGHQKGSVPIISVQTDFPLPCQVRPQKNSSNHINKNRCFFEDTNNTMASLYSCFLATAASTAQQNATSSPSEDNPQADLGGLWDRAVIALGWESFSSFLSFHLLCLPMTSSGTWDGSSWCDGFFWKGALPSCGTRGPEYLRAQWEWFSGFLFFWVGPSECVSLSDGLSLALTSFPLCQTTCIHLQRAWLVWVSQVGGMRPPLLLTPHP